MGAQDESSFDCSVLDACHCRDNSSVHAKRDVGHLTKISANFFRLDLEGKAVWEYRYLYDRWKANVSYWGVFLFFFLFCVFSGSYFPPGFFFFFFSFLRFLWVLFIFWLYSPSMNVEK